MTDTIASRRSVTNFCIAFAATALVLVVFRHWTHVSPFLTYALILACPLMHIFMHRGHKAHDHRAERSVSATTSHDENPAD